MKLNVFMPLSFMLARAVDRLTATDAAGNEVTMDLSGHETALDVKAHILSKLGNYIDPQMLQLLAGDHEVVDTDNAAALTGQALVFVTPDHERMQAEALEWLDVRIAAGSEIPAADLRDFMLEQMIPLVKVAPIPPTHEELVDRWMKRGGPQVFDKESVLKAMREGNAEAFLFAFTGGASPPSLLEPVRTMVTAEEHTKAFVEAVRRFNLDGMQIGLDQVNTILVPPPGLLQMIPYVPPTIPAAALNAIREQLAMMW